MQSLHCAEASSSILIRFPRLHPNPEFIGISRLMNTKACTRTWSVVHGRFSELPSEFECVT